MTPTGCCADTVTASDLVALSPGKEIPKTASLDAALHLAVYAHNGLAGCVLHSHGPYSIAITLSGESFRPVDFEGSHYFPVVPVIDIPYDEYVEHSPQKVAEALKSHPITIVRGHGVYAWGRNLNAAYKWTSSLESSATIASLACPV